MKYTALNAGVPYLIPNALMGYTKIHRKKIVRLKLHFGDLSDSTNIIRIIQEVQPDEIYNLGAMSHVRVSFDEPEYTAQVDGIGTLRILEAVRLLGLTEKTRIYQASTSELYGGCRATPNRKQRRFIRARPMRWLNSTATGLQ